MYKHNSRDASRPINQLHDFSFILSIFVCYNSPSPVSCKPLLYLGHLFFCCMILILMIHILSSQTHVLSVFYNVSRHQGKRVRAGCSSRTSQQQNENPMRLKLTWHVPKCLVIHICVRVCVHMFPIICVCLCLHSSATLWLSSSISDSSFFSLMNVRSELYSLCNCIIRCSQLKSILCWALSPV